MIFVLACMPWLGRDEVHHRRRHRRRLTSVISQPEGRIFDGGHLAQSRNNGVDSGRWR